MNRIDAPAADWRHAYEEFLAQRTALPLLGWQTLVVRGSDARQVLHNLCTNQVRSLAPGEGCEAFFTDVKGRTRAHGFLLVRADDVLALVEPGSAADLVSHLMRYVIREDAAAEEATPSSTWFVAAGLAAVRQAFAAEVDLASAARWQHLPLGDDQAAGVVVRSDLPFSGCCFAGLPSESPAALSAARRWEKAAAERALDAVRLEGRWPWWGVDYGPGNLPQEVGRDAEAISFRKGCYLGQETVARLDALGHVNRRLALLRMEAQAAPPSAGSPVTLQESPPSGPDGPGAGARAVGEITSAAWSPRENAPLGWAMLQAAVVASGAKLRCGGAVAVVLPADAAAR
jgi:folate-binding protein YgfZ